MGVLTSQPVSLWRSHDFLKFWTGQTLSGFGSRFTGLALPLVAISTLDASPAQLGLLTAASGLPWLLFGPIIGVGIDRFRRRPILIASDLGRGILLAAIPLAAFAGVLRIEYLYAIAFLSGLLSAWFDTAYQSYLPSLVEREQLLDGNGKLGMSDSTADVVGPSLAGVVIQVFTAPIAILIDACSFLASALSLMLIRKQEAAPDRGGKQPIWALLREGITYLWQHILLRAIAATNSSFMFCYGISQAVLLLFLTDNLRLGPGVIGVIFSAGSIGGLVGAAVASNVSRRFRIGPTIIMASLLRGLGIACVPLAAALPFGMIPVLVAAYTVHSFGWSIWAINQGSLRQSLAPDRLRGRVTASFLFLVRSATPLGALVGGLLGERFGVTPTLTIAAAGLVLSTGWLFISPLWHVRSQPVSAA